MTAIKSHAHIKQLAQQRLPVPSAEVERLVEENERLREALSDVIRANDWYMSDCPMNDPNPVTEACSRARAALSTQERES